MAATSVKYPGSTTTKGSDDPWTNIGNITSDNNTDATCVIGSQDNGSSYAVGYNFGFTSSDIPSGSTIDGIVVEVEAWRSAGSIAGELVFILYSDATGGTQIGDTVFSGLNITGTRAVYTAGSPSDTWNSSATQSQVVNSSFGAGVRYRRTSSSGTVAFDFIRVTIYYTAPTTKIPQVVSRLQAVPRASSW